MSIINSQPLIGASGQGGYFLTKSLRFRSSASAYLNRTPASAGNRKTWTWSAWVKRGAIADGVLFSVGTSGSSYFNLRFQDNSGVQEFSAVSENPSTDITLRTSQQFRDPSAWYHLVFVLDTTQATSSNRAKFYVNGSQVTAFSSATYPSQNADLLINNNQAHNIARRASASDLYFDGYMTEINFIDGQALTPSSFGETSTSTGVWIPKKYTGTYGTNGFYLPFTDVATTSGSNAGLGKDFSGNGNYWTTNNISVTSGTTYDSMKDVPTLTDTDTANYCVLNPLDKGTSFSISNGNLTADINAARPVFASVKGTIGITSGKYYWEFVKTSSGSGLVQSGVWANDNLSVNVNTDLNGSLGSLTNIGMFGATSSNAIIKTGLSTQDASTLGSYTNGDVIGIAFDADNGKLYAYKNGTEFTGQAIGSGTSILPTMATGKTYHPFVYSGNGGSGTETATTNINFGQRPFAYTPPTGFKALNTFNLPTPTIGATASTRANKYFDINLWTGNSSARSFTNSGSMQPDFVWVKDRTTAGIWNVLFDSVRGAGNQLSSNQTDAELASASSIAGKVSAFNSDGFSVVTGSSSYYSVNQTGDSYVGWQWRANGTAVTNTAGSITSTVSANTTAGFSIVTYTSPNSTSNQTVGHGLGVKPSMIIVKNRDSAFNWDIYHSSLGYNSSLIFTIAATRSGAFGAEPTSTVFTTTNTYTHNGTDKYVAYCFAQVAGYSAFGSYTGNGSSDGVFVHLGFRPRFVMVKQTDAVGNWLIWDTARTTRNQMQDYLSPNNSSAELNNVLVSIDALSNGFKCRTADDDINGNGNSYIYMAFAESPFKFSNAR